MASWGLIRFDWFSPGSTSTSDLPANSSDTLSEEAQWLRLQRAHAFHPERTRDELELHSDPAVLLTRLRAAEGELPFSREPDSRAVVAAAKRVERDQAKLRSLGATTLPLPSERYPTSLRALKDAPPVLLVRGNVSALSGPAIAIVGARAATRSAQGQARRIARELAGCGFTIVSGLARGVDAAAHSGALDAGGKTVAVLACGIDEIYPPEHRGLAEEICGRGAVVSEMPIGTPPRKELFPLRNRIISGLSHGVIVAEARKRSGSLITVRHALEQGREVWALPGTNDGPFAAGSNQLLREGARAIRRAADVIEDLGFQPPKLLGSPLAAEPSDRPAAIGADADAGVDPLVVRIREVLEEAPLPREALAGRCAVDLQALATALIEMELAGEIMEERDGRFHLVWR